MTPQLLVRRANGTLTVAFLVGMVCHVPDDAFTAGVRLGSRDADGMVAVQGDPRGVGDAGADRAGVGGRARHERGVPQGRGVAPDGDPVAESLCRRGACWPGRRDPVGPPGARGRGRGRDRRAVLAQVPRPAVAPRDVQVLDRPRARR